MDIPFQPDVTIDDSIDLTEGNYDTYFSDILKQKIYLCQTFDALKDNGKLTDEDCTNFYNSADKVKTAFKELKRRFLKLFHDQNIDGESTNDFTRRIEFNIGHLTQRQILACPDRAKKLEKTAPSFYSQFFLHQQQRTFKEKYRNPLLAIGIGAGLFGIVKFSHNTQTGGFFNSDSKANFQQSDQIEPSQQRAAIVDVKDDSKKNATPSSSQSSQSVINPNNLPSHTPQLVAQAIPDIPSNKQLPSQTSLPPEKSHSVDVSDQSLFKGNYQKGEGPSQVLHRLFKDAVESQKDYRNPEKGLSEWQKAKLNKLGKNIWKWNGVSKQFVSQTNPGNPQEGDGISFDSNVSVAAYYQSLLQSSAGKDKVKAVNMGGRGIIQTYAYLLYLRLDGKVHLSDIQLAFSQEPGLIALKTLFEHNNSRDESACEWSDDVSLGSEFTADLNEAQKIFEAPSVQQMVAQERGRVENVHNSPSESASVPDMPQQNSRTPYFWETPLSAPPMAQMDFQFPTYQLKPHDFIILDHSQEEAKPRLSGKVTLQQDGFLTGWRNSIKHSFDSDFVPYYNEQVEGREVVEFTMDAFDGNDDLVLDVLAHAFYTLHGPKFGPEVYLMKMFRSDLRLKIISILKHDYFHDDGTFVINMNGFCEEIGKLMMKTSKESLRGSIPSSSLFDEYEFQKDSVEKDAEANAAPQSPQESVVSQNQEEIVPDIHKKSRFGRMLAKVTSVFAKDGVSQQAIAAFPEFVHGTTYAKIPHDVDPQVYLKKKYVFPTWQERMNNKHRSPHWYQTVKAQMEHHDSFINSLKVPADGVVEIPLYEGIAVLSDEDVHELTLISTQTVPRIDHQETQHSPAEDACVVSMPEILELTQEDVYEPSQEPPAKLQKQAVESVQANNGNGHMNPPIVRVPYHEIAKTPPPKVIGKQRDAAYRKLHLWPFKKVA